MNQLSYDDHGNIISNKIIKNTIIGNKYERKTYKWNRLNRLHNQSIKNISYDKIIFWKIRDILKNYTYKNGYSFSLNEILSLSKFGFKLYKDILNKNLHSNLLIRVNNICFIVIYLHFSLKGTYINLKKLSVYFNIENNYKSILSLFLKHYRKYNLKLISYDIRKKIIMNYIYNYIDVSNALRFLENNWIILSKVKNSTIIGVLLRKFFIKKSKTLTKVFEILELNDSSSLVYLSNLRKRNIYLKSVSKSISNVNYI